MSYSIKDGLGAIQQVFAFFVGSAPAQILPAFVQVDGMGDPIGVPGNSLSVAPYVYTPLGFQPIADLSGVQHLPAIPAEATIAVIAIEGNAARYRDDGVSPSASVGMPLYAGTSFQYQGNLAALELIQQSGGAATASVLYYK